MPPGRVPIITLLTDYGTRDHFVASMKGVIFNINSNVEVVDISHQVNPGDLVEAAFLLRSCYSYFPTRTIHVVVVDPTVGSARKPIIAATDNHYFIAPDNGVLSFIYDAEPISSVVEITADHVMLPEVSKTFHGRDIFAPAAAWLAKGTGMMNFGDELQDYVKLPFPKPRMMADGVLKGSAIHIDRFGNIITNISKQDFEQAREKFPGQKTTIIIAKQEISGLREFYSEAQKGELIALFGSGNFLEIAQNQGTAAKTLGISRGAEVSVLLK